MDAGFLDMKNKMRRSTVVIVAALGLGAPVMVSGCGLGVLSQLTPPDAAQPPMDVVLTACDPNNLPAGCDTICVQAQQVLQQDCAACHAVGNTNGMSSGSITDYHALVNVRASSMYLPGTFYVVPGDPDNSLIYKRIIDGEMPPAASEVGSYPLPRPTTSDESALLQWIRQCVPKDYHPDAGTPPSN